MPLAHRPVLLLVNGVIHTMDEQTPRVSALAIDLTSGRILATGDDTDMRALSGPLTETIDLHGRTVLPGFIDAHAHLVHYASRAWMWTCVMRSSEEEAVARVAARAAQTSAGTWIFGRSWDKNHWPGQNFPSKASLDAAIPGRPVALSSHDYHSLWVNSEALRRAGVDASTPNPGRGRIGRGDDGEPDGMLYEDATSLVYEVADPASDERLLAELRIILAELRARGLTGVHNIEDDRSLRLLQRLRAGGELTPRVLYYIRGAALPHSRLGYGGRLWRRLPAFRRHQALHGWRTGSQTAAMLDPYEGQPRIAAC